MPAVKLPDLPVSFPLAQIIARDLGVRAAQVEATIALIEEGATIPFIARYRKERTGGLDDTQLRTLAERFAYLTELQARRETILASVSEQGKLTPPLERALWAAETKVELEDLYRPYKPRRRTRAMIAREQGLEPLADKLLACAGDPETLAAAFMDSATGVATVAAALEGARDILIERMAETPSLARHARETIWTAGELRSRLVKGKQAEKFRDYAEFAEPLEKMPSHRALAMLRADFQRFKSQPEYTGLGAMMRQRFVDINQAKKKAQKSKNPFKACCAVLGGICGMLCPCLRKKKPPAKKKAARKAPAKKAASSGDSGGATPSS